MNASLSKNIEYKSVTILPTFEKVHALLADIHLYLFGPEGNLIREQAVRRGKATLFATEDEWRNGRIVLAPQLDDLIDKPLTLEAARGHLVFEAVLGYENTQSSYELPPVPEDVWRWWLVHSLWESVGGTLKKKSRLSIW